MNSNLQRIESHACHGGVQEVWQHDSATLGCSLRFGVYLPPQAQQGACPVLYWLSGLTCTEQNFITKAGAQRYAAEHGLILVSPDTSPRGDDVPDDENKAWDFGLGAGFYINATQAPFDKNYRMYDYVQSELPALIAKEFGDKIDSTRQSISGHSMGGHGALTLAIRNPQQYKSVSAFSPIVAPTQCAWGEKAFGNYFGDNKTLWAEHDTCELITARGFDKPILVEQGLADNFLINQLKPELLEDACKNSNVQLTVNRREGYDHSYYFISTFFENHLRYHAKYLK